MVLLARGVYATFNHRPFHVAPPTSDRWTPPRPLCLMHASVLDSFGYSAHFLRKRGDLKFPGLLAAFLSDLGFHWASSRLDPGGRWQAGAASKGSVSNLGEFFCSFPIFSFSSCPSLGDLFFLIFSSVFLVKNKTLTLTLRKCRI